MKGKWIPCKGSSQEVSDVKKDLFNISGYCKECNRWFNLRKNSQKLPRHKEKQNEFTTSRARNH